MKSLPNYRKELVSRQMLLKETLIRVVVNQSGEVFIDPTYTAEGRGAYLQKDLQAIKIARDRNLLNKSLKTQVNPQIYKELEALINEQE